MDGTVEQDLDSAPAVNPGREAEAKFALATSAVIRAASDPATTTAVNGYLSTVIAALNTFEVIGDRDNLFDVKIVAAIERSELTINQYTRLLDLIVKTADIDSYEPLLLNFLEGVLEHKRHQAEPGRAAYLWRDPIRFIARELFLVTIATLLANKRWPAVRTLLDHKYVGSTGTGAVGFTAFDGFLRSIDVFRNRRLKLHRPSLSADILKARVAKGPLPVLQLTRADFILHLYSLSRESGNSPWSARTLSLRQDTDEQDVEIMRELCEGEHQECLQALFGVPDWPHLMEKVRESVQLQDKRVSGQAGWIDYTALLAAKSGVFK